MTRKRIANLGASVRARLLEIAKDSNRDYNAVLSQYFQERFLFRLSRSPYRSKFILKGALLFMAYKMPRRRPTKDIDFLGHEIGNDPAEIGEAIKKIAAISFGDGVTFSALNVRVEKIRDEAKYSGVRAKIGAELGGARGNLQIDIGFGDKIVAGPVEIDFPALLDFPPPRILVYSKESAIAEKFEASVRFNFLSSRMKDFYDILFMAEQETFILQSLQEAIVSTFSLRRTPLEERRIIFEDTFKRDNGKQEQWGAFLKRNQLQSFEQFLDAMKHLESFLEPVCGVVGSGKKKRTWRPDLWRWE